MPDDPVHMSKVNMPKNYWQEVKDSSNPGNFDWEVPRRLLCYGKKPVCAQYVQQRSIDLLHLNQ